MLKSLYSNTINSLHANDSTILKIFLGKNHCKNITTAIQKYQIWKNVEQNSFTRRVESTYEKEWICMTRFNWNYDGPSAQSNLIIDF